jgi:hypothetical protein
MTAFFAGVGATLAFELIVALAYVAWIITMLPKDEDELY